MLTNKQKFLKLVSSDESTKFLDFLKFRIDNRKELKRSQLIALKILYRLDDLNITKQELALFCNVDVEEITKLVQGKSINLDNELLDKIEMILNVEFCRFNK